MAINYTNNASVPGFIPTLFSKNAVVEFEAASKLIGLIDYSYSSEAQYGKQLRIPTLSSLTAEAYSGSGDINITAPSETEVVLDIDQEIYQAMSIKNLTAVQASVNVFAKYTAQQAKAIGNYFDKAIAAEIANASASVGNYTTGVTVEKVLDTATKLSENNVPFDGNVFLALLPSSMNQLRKDILAMNYSLGITSELAGVAGYVGNLGGFEIFESNNILVTNGTEVHNMAFHRSAIAAVIQQEATVELVPFPRQKSMDLITTIIYGLKTVRPEALIELKSVK